MVVIPVALGHVAGVSPLPDSTGPRARRSAVASAIAIAIASLAVAACGYRPPYRYANSPEVIQSAQRASVGGLLRYACLWRQEGIADARVELLATDDPVPLATAITAPDGRFLLTTDFLSDPQRESRVRVTVGEATDEALLPGPLDENYAVVWEVACPEDRPNWLATDRETVALAPGEAPADSGQRQARRDRILWHRGVGTGIEFDRILDQYGTMRAPR